MADLSAATTPTDLANRLLQSATTLIGRRRTLLLDLLSQVQLGAAIKVDAVSACAGS